MKVASLPSVLPLGQQRSFGFAPLPQRRSAAVSTRQLTWSCHRHLCSAPARLGSITSQNCSALVHLGRCAPAGVSLPPLGHSVALRRVLCASSKADSSKIDSSNSRRDDTDISVGSSSTAAAGGADDKHLADSKQQHSGPAAKAAKADAGSDDDFEHQTDYENCDEDEWEDEYEDGDEGSEDEGGSPVSDMTDADAAMEAVLRENTLNAAVLELAASMFAVGLQGSAAIGLGYLVLHRSLFDSFRWKLADVETAFMFSLPVAALSIAITALPLPTHKQMMNKVMAAATEAAGGSSDSIGSEKTRSFDAFNDARRMATNASLVSDIPVRVVVGGDETGEQQPLTRLSLDTATQALRYMQEFVTEPWSTKTYSLKSWGVRAVGGLLRRLSVELFWRGLVVAGLAGWLYSSWETAGTSQDSPLFYARLFGLLTPQAALAVIASILAATRIPADLARTQPAVTYTRLASMEVEVVGRLTEDDWLVMVLPAEVAAAAAATAAAKGIKPRKVTVASDIDLDVKEALTQKVKMFGRMKADSSSSSSSGGGGKAAPSQQQPQLSKQEMEQQLDKLTAAVSEWKRTYSSISSSSSSSSSSDTAAASRLLAGLAGFELTQREADAAELAAELLELVKASAAAKASAAVATKSKYIAKSAGLASAKLGTGLEALLRAVNDDPQRRLFLLHVGTDGSGSSLRKDGIDGSSSSGSSSEDDSSDDDDDSTPGSVQAVLRAKARTAAEGVRQDDSSKGKGKRASSSLEVTGDESSKDESSSARQQGGLDEAVSSLKEAMKGLRGKQQQGDKQDGAADAPSSSSSSSAGGKDPAAASSSSNRKASGNGSDSDSDSDSDDDEGLTFRELESLLKKQMKQLQTQEGQSSDLALYLKASKGAYRVAASIPTAQDKVAYSLLLGFALLEQVAVAGTFVASSGNLAASFTAAAALQVLTTTLQQAVGQRERQRLRKDVGSGWALQLQMFGAGPMGGS